jgi:hypothetical protein
MSPIRPQKLPNQVVVDLKELRPIWDAWCANERLTFSEALRRLVSRLEPGRAQEPAPMVPEPLGSPRVSRRPRLLLGDEQ